MGESAHSILLSATQALDVTYDNLANAHTMGHKRSDLLFGDVLYQQKKSASAPSGSTGGQNPQEIGMGVQVLSNTKIMTDGPLTSTGRSMDFGIAGSGYFFAAKNNNGMMVYTRHGRFNIDGHNNVVDSQGNTVMGFNCDISQATSPSLTSYATPIQLPTQGMNATGTTLIQYSATLACNRQEMTAGSNTNAFELFSGGEAFGDLTSAVSAVNSTQRTQYGAYADSICYKTTQAGTVMATGTGVVTMGALDASLAGTGFQVGDTVVVRQTNAGVTTAYQTTVTAAVAATSITVNVASIPAGWTNATTVQVVNLSRKTTTIGSNNTAPGTINNDVLHNQVGMVDQNGNLVASFHRVTGHAQGYTKAVATQVNGANITMGTGEFTNMFELGKLIESALKDGSLSYNSVPDSTALVSIDKFGKISTNGAGITNNFRLVVNADNTQFASCMGSLLYTNAAGASGTQAVLNAASRISNPAALAMGNRAGNSSNSWFQGVANNYGYNSNSPGTAYGEFAGLRLSSSSNPFSYGQVQLSMVNALGQTQTRVFSCVPRQADAIQFQFQTMGDLVTLIDSTLKSPAFSTVVDSSSNLVTDSSAGCQLTGDGRLSISTSSGSFNNLVLSSLSTGGDPSDGVTRTDSMNFGSVLGQLSHGVNGMGGASNVFIQANESNTTAAFDNKGDLHQVKTFYTLDQTPGMSEIEWKFKAGLEVNGNDIVLGSTPSSSASYRDLYVATFNNVADIPNLRGVLGFDMVTNNLLQTGQNGDNRYKNQGEVKFQYQDVSLRAAPLDISLDFSQLKTAKKDGSVVFGERKDGNAAGDLIDYTTEDGGAIVGVYSNGVQRVCARIGLMAFSNPEGLSRIGSTYYQATSNSDSNPIKDAAQIFAINPLDAADGKTAPKILAGKLEDSNVDIVQEMTNGMEFMQHYTLGLSLMRQGNELMETTISALS